MIATSEHSAAIEADLRRRSIDVDGLKRRGDLVVLDARETLLCRRADGAA